MAYDIGVRPLEEEVERLRHELVEANRAVSEAGIINPGEPLASRIWRLMVQRDVARAASSSKENS